MSNKPYARGAPKELTPQNKKDDYGRQVDNSDEKTEAEVAREWQKVDRKPTPPKPDTKPTTIRALYRSYTNKKGSFLEMKTKLYPGFDIALKENHTLHWAFSSKSKTEILTCKWLCLYPKQKLPDWDTKTFEVEENH